MADVQRDSDHGIADTAGELVRKEYDWSATAPSVAVVRAIADAEGVPPAVLATDGDTVLNEHVDPDALDALVTARPDRPVEITFDVGAYTVRIDGSELVVAPTGVQPS